VIISCSSTTPGVAYSWTGPNGYTYNGASATVTTPGNYTVTVTNSGNSCSTSVSAATVTQNTTVPGSVSASVTDKLTCNKTSVTLKGSSSTPGVSYAWAGPNEFTASTQNTTVTVGGSYTLTATDPTNGCSFSTPITVQADQNHPVGVTATSDGSLNCDIASVNLIGGSSTAGVNFTWTGPNGFFDPEQNASVTDSGTYFLTVSNPGNGCTTIASVMVAADFAACSMVLAKAVSSHAATLDAPAGNTGGSSGLVYKVYPNPVSTMAFVSLTSPEDAHVMVEVYNSIGIREKVLFDGTVEAGAAYQWTLGASRLTPGIHYCIIRTNNKAYTSRLLITSGR
jgi:hypothetical protein